ncbi:MAG: ATP-binding cassette domain-containing protein [Candidatus Eisenbacteria bacterium]|nr:ATP-binding cassette domain-containing protein [Candidatus Latescibacterota bacterium]MBD3303310.1 ATP-binding cassette domain-containing protein [Candidatus Eisenbacteria bacterium]
MSEVDGQAIEPQPPILSFEDAGRVHGTGPKAVRALGPVRIDVRAGEFVAVMGPSGSGKSTLLSLAGALDQPTDGTVRVQGWDLSTLSAGARAALRRRTIGFVFQDLNLLPGLTALENVALPLELDGCPLREAREEALGSLERVQMDRLAHRFPDDLSGGEQQRVAVARAFVGPRALMLADEPTGALDSVTGEMVMRLLRKQCDAGRTVVLVTHDASHASWADRVLFLKDGLVVDETRTPSASSTATPLPDA